MGATVYASYGLTSAPPEPVGPPVGGPIAFPQTVLRTFRDAIREIVPRWLRAPIGGSVLFAVGTQLDTLMDGLRYGVRARWPGYQPDALPLLSHDRRLRQGLHETDDHFGERLPEWWDKHRYRGGPYALLEQVWEYYAPENFPVELRYATGRRFQMDVAGEVVRDIVSWTPPGDPAKWSRWWLTYQWPDTINPDGLWSDPGTWDDGGVWDTDLSADEVRSIRLIPKEWGTGHAIGYISLNSPGLDITISAESP